MDGWALATIAAVLLAFAAASGRHQRSYITAAMFFVTAGLLAGPVLGLLDLDLGLGISVYAHGVSEGPLTERYVAWFKSHPQDRRPAMERVSAAKHRWRTPSAVRG